MKLLVSCIFLLGSFSTQARQIADDKDKFEYFYNGNVKIAYRVFGSGLPLIVINGGPGRSSDTFTELAQTLSAKNKRVILFDQRGTGRSKLDVVNEDTINLNLMISDLDGLRKHLQYDKVAILGHSFGGMYAMAYASQYPDNIKSLILSASGGVDVSWQEYTIHNMLARLTEGSRIKYKFWTSSEQRKRDPTRATLEALRLLIPAYIYNQKFVPQLEKALINLDYYSPRVNSLVWKSMKNFNLGGALKTLRAPTLIISGRQDILGEAVPMTIRDQIPNAQLEFINECSHYPWLDRPDRYFYLIENFLTR